MNTKTFCYALSVLSFLCSIEMDSMSDSGISLASEYMVIRDDEQSFKNNDYRIVVVANADDGGLIYWKVSTEELVQFIKENPSLFPDGENKQKLLEYTLETGNDRAGKHKDIPYEFAHRELRKAILSPNNEYHFGSRRYHIVPVDKREGFIKKWKNATRSGKPTSEELKRLKKPKSKKHSKRRDELVEKQTDAIDDRPTTSASTVMTGPIAASGTSTMVSEDSGSSAPAKPVRVTHVRSAAKATRPAFRVGPVIQSQERINRAEATSKFRSAAAEEDRRVAALTALRRRQNRPRQSSVAGVIEYYYPDVKPAPVLE